MRSRFRTRLIASAAVAAAMLTGGLLTGGASVAAATPQACSYDLSTQVKVCADDVADLNAAVLAQTGKRVIAAPNGSRVTPNAASAAATTYVIVQLYNDSNYGGAMFQITNSQQCGTGFIFYFNDLGPNGWANRAGSFKSFSGCSTTVYNLPNQGGAKYGPHVNAPTLDLLDDASESTKSS